MKKIKFLLLVVIVITFSNVYAQTDDTLTHSQFITEYLNKMQNIVDLRTQTETARNANNTIVNQIRTQINDSNRVAVQNKVQQIKTINQTNKDLLSQANTYANQRTHLRKDWQNALKDRDTSKTTTIKDQITDLTNKIESIRSQIKTNRQSIVPLVNDVKAYRDANKSIIEQVKNLVRQNVAIQDKITSEKLEKDKLWQDFATNVKERNYTEALKIMDSIIIQKQVILADIQSKITALNEIVELQQGV